MTELKTLKDLFINKDGTEWECDPDHHIHIENVRDELKAEAVKWVKSLELKQDHTEYTLQRNSFRSPKPKQEISEELRKQLEGFYDQQIIEWIKHFFNLTEEDLK